MKRETIEINLVQQIPEDSQDSNVLDEIVALEPAADGRTEAGPLAGMVIGTLAARDASGRPLVDFPGNPTAGPLLARSAVAHGDEQVGRSVALMFEEGDAGRPLMLAFVDDTAVGDSATGSDQPADQSPVTVEAATPERLVLAADREIVLRCGKASITLTKAGKILIRGAYLLSRSSGVNRVKGGSVQIN